MAKERPLPGDPVKGRRPCSLVAVGTAVHPGLIVRDGEEDVRSRGSRRASLQTARQNRQEKINDWSRLHSDWFQAGLSGSFFSAVASHLHIVLPCGAGCAAPTANELLQQRLHLLDAPGLAAGEVLDPC